MTRLVVIEAAGKLRTVHQCLDALGVKATVAATLGHLYDNPPTLDPLAIGIKDGELVETGRREAHPGVLAYLRQAIAKADEVVIATDPDIEGHVIAQDVADLVTASGRHIRVMRACPHAMTVSGWRTALADMHPLDTDAAKQGTARRLLDRMLAFASTEMADGRPGVALGRVQTALLGLAEQGRIPDRRVRLSAPASDGGGAFVGTGVMHGPVPPDALPALDVDETQVEALGTLMNGADALLALHEEMRLPVDEAASLLQAMYEAGEISYPRSTGRGLRSEGAEAVTMLARARAIRPFRSALLPRLAESDGAAHEAVHVVMKGWIERLNVSKPLRLMGNEREAAGTVIARRCVEGGVGVTRSRPVPAALPSWARELSWERTSPRPALGWRSRAPSTESALTLEAAALHVQQRHGIGQPSTWARHAGRLAASGWIVPSSHGLSVPGRLQWAATQEALRQPATTGAMNTVLNDARLSVRERVEEALLLAFGGDETTVNALLDTLEGNHHDAPNFCM